MSSDLNLDAIPNGFWKQIDHQLDRIVIEQPETFQAVKVILDDPAYTDIQIEIHRNGTRAMPTGQTFFSGSGGDRSIAGALVAAGWAAIWSKASYHYAMRHTSSADRLTYIEGDLVTGDRR